MSTDVQGHVSDGWSRTWSQFVAGIGDHYPLGVTGLALTLFLLALAAAILSQRFIWRRRPERVYDQTVDDVQEQDADEELPDLPSDHLRARARSYAEAGDHRRAVREWLRAMVRELVDREVIDYRPGWTVTELAAAASVALPSAAAPMDEATRIFSDIWYGQRPADAGRTQRMADLDGQVSAAVKGRLAGSST